MDVLFILILAFQGSTERLLDKYGWPTAILAAVCTVVYAVIKKAIWPYVVLYFSDARTATLEAKQALIDRAKRLEELQDGMMQDFKVTLEKAGARADKQIELLVEILDTVRRQPPTGRN